MILRAKKTGSPMVAGRTQIDEEKRLLAQLESLCLDAGRRNSQHEQQHEQKVEKSLEEIPRGSEVRRRLRLSFVDPESLEKGVTSRKKSNNARDRNAVRAAKKWKFERLNCKKC